MENFCEYCKNEFKKKHGSQKYCSFKCQKKINMVKYHKKHRQKLINDMRDYRLSKFDVTFHFWHKIVVPAVLRRDDYTCQNLECDSDINLDVAHKRYSEDITINDLTTLCRKHHKEFDNPAKFTR